MRAMNRMLISGGAIALALAPAVSFAQEGMEYPGATPEEEERNQQGTTEQEEEDLDFGEGVVEEGPGVIEGADVTPQQEERGMQGEQRSQGMQSDEGGETDMEIGEEIAEDFDLESDDDEGMIDNAVLTPFGAQLQVGGGARGFTNPGVTDNAQPGAYWDVRGVVGTRSFIGAEAAYIGSVQGINALGLDDNAMLLGNGLEGAVRLNAPLALDFALFEPYAFGGLGWQRYNLLNQGVNTSSVANVDDIMTVPLGAGMAFNLAGFTIDTRATYRHAFFSDLVGSPTSSFAPTSLNGWNVGLGVGYEF